MKKNSFIIVCTLLVTALTLVIRTKLNEQDAPATTAGSLSGQVRENQLVKKAARLTSPSSHRPESVNARTEALVVRPGDATPASFSEQSGSADARAERVQARALTKLTRLTGTLGLSGDQQRRVFPILARSDPDFDATMIIGQDPGNHFASGRFYGSGAADNRTPLVNDAPVIHPPSASPGKRDSPRGDAGVLDSTGASPSRVDPETASKDPHVKNIARNNVDAAVDGTVPTSVDTAVDTSSAIYRELTPEQQALFEETLIDDGLWWTDILAQIERDYNRTNPPPVTTDPVIIDDPGAGENLFDLLGQ